MLKLNKIFVHVKRSNHKNTSASRQINVNFTHKRHYNDIRDTEKHTCCRCRQLRRRNSKIPHIHIHERSGKRFPMGYTNCKPHRMSLDRPAMGLLQQNRNRRHRLGPLPHYRPLRWLYNLLNILQRSPCNTPKRQRPLLCTLSCSQYPCRNCTRGGRVLYDQVRHSAKLSEAVF